MNKQREAIYAMRRELLEGVDQREHLVEMSEDLLFEIVDKFASREADPRDWDIENLRVALRQQFGLDLQTEGINPKILNYHELSDTLQKRLEQKYAEKEQKIGPPVMRFHERMIMLQIIDSQWKDHLLALDHLKEGIGLRGFGQRDPLVEYKRESYDMFQALLDRIDEETVRFLHLLQPVSEEDRRQELERERQRASMVFSGANQGGGDGPVVQRREGHKVGRNDPCPCGSGKKYKRCHGA
jgi:preprotein translocase subunit SecA